MGADRLRTEARLSPIDKKLFWRRQFLNPYAFESAPAALRALVELSSSPGSRLSPMNQQIRAFGKANTGHQLIRVPPIFGGNDDRSCVLNHIRWIDAFPRSNSSSPLSILEDFASFDCKLLTESQRGTGPSLKGKLAKRTPRSLKRRPRGLAPERPMMAAFVRYVLRSTRR